MPRTIIRRSLAGSLVLACLLTASTPAGAAGPGRELDLTFERTGLGANAGKASLSVATLTHNGGGIARAERPGGGTAIDLPAYRASQPRLALMTVVDRIDGDSLNPGTSAFTFGADFRLDARNEGSSADNGNNLIQRGLFDAPSQYKIELDGNRPGCRVKGRDGAVSVRSSRAVAADRWYWVTCTRAARTVTLKVTRVGGTTWTYRATGRTGSMRPSSSSVPLSIGGKVSNSGKIVVKSADQFNGHIDNPFLNVS